MAEPIQPDYIRGRHGKRSWPEAFKLYMHDAKKSDLLLALRAVAVILAAFTPFTLLNDLLIPFTAGLAIADDVILIVAIPALIKVIHGVRQYRTLP